jgi:hypothetical protein
MISESAMDKGVLITQSSPVISKLFSALTLLWATAMPKAFGPEESKNKSDLEVKSFHLKSNSVRCSIE